MTDYYNEDFIKSIMAFEKPLDKDWFTELDKISDPNEIISTLKWQIHHLQFAVRALYIVVETEMKQTNRIRALMEKLPKTDEFNEIKIEMERQRKDSVEVLLPIKKLAEAVEESKNKKLDYIG